MNNNPIQRRLKPGDVRVVNINGRLTTLVIGRSYTFQMKPGTNGIKPSSTTPNLN